MTIEYRTFTVFNNFPLLMVTVQLNDLINLFDKITSSFKTPFAYYQYFASSIVCLPNKLTAELLRYVGKMKVQLQ